MFYYSLLQLLSRFLPLFKRWFIDVDSGLKLWTSIVPHCLPFTPSRACHPGLVDDRTKIWHHFKFHDVTVTWPRILKAASPYSSASSSFALRCPRGCFGFEGLTAVSRSHRISRSQVVKLVKLLQKIKNKQNSALPETRSPQPRRG